MIEEVFWPASLKITGFASFLNNKTMSKATAAELDFAQVKLLEKLSRLESVGAKNKRK